MLCLGIESTAHTFGAAVVDGKGKILSNERSVYTSEGKGIVPREVARWHEEKKDGVITVALEKAGITLGDVELVAYSRGPGIGNCLAVGLKAAEALGKPTVGVNHCVSHLEIGRLVTKARDPVFLYVSGANTQIIAFEGKKYRVFGETLDIGVGNLLDKFARELELGFPGGPKLYELGKAGHYLPMPYGVKGMDVCFSGLLTHASKLVGKETAADLAYSLQETAFSMLIEVSERAMAHCGKKELLLGGGVAASKILQEKAEVMCAERGATCFPIPPLLAVDNAAMIAWQGILERRNARVGSWDINPDWRTDDVAVYWRA
ncbi:UGMP family protein [Candidatus Micrarchaeota archaeon CG08_land_8_20_14_0_20_59_11]|nr:MAG: UGMP family protein [Candidatus Micrarchaeota archaeon CG08_land_8_20_14_0_20_59_11]